MRVLLLGIVFFSLLVGCRESFADGTEKYHSWDLPALTKKQRVQSVETFVKKNSYNLIDNNYTSSQIRKCDETLHKIKNITAENILTPNIVANSLNDYQIKNFLQKCSKKIDPFNSYIPSKEFWLNDKDKKNKNSFFVLTDKNIEVYDLSNSIGSGYWGIFAEGGRPKCENSNNPDCLNMVGFYSISKIISIESCLEYDFGMPISRLYPNSQRIKDELIVKFSPTQSFFTFVELDKEIYQLSFKTSSNQSDRCDQKNECFSRIKSARLYLSEWSNVSSNPNNTTCIFSLEKKGDE